MSHTTASLTNDIHTSIRAHYASGHFNLDTALARIQNAGFVTLTRQHAAEILAAPIGVETVKALTGKSGETITAEQITARLAEVTA